MIVHLIDGTYELFRHFYGIRRFKKIDPPFGAMIGLASEFIPDSLGLVGDAADDYPGILALGAKTAATLLNRHGHIEQFPAGVLRDGNLERALLFKTLATLRIDAPLFKNVDELRWAGPTASFAQMTEKIGDA